MTIIIVGAGDIGLRLVELAMGNDVDFVVEENTERAETVRTEYDCTVINDDPASLQTLKEAGGEGADTPSLQVRVTTRSISRPAC